MTTSKGHRARSKQEGRGAKIALRNSCATLKRLRVRLLLALLLALRLQPEK
jgi:hypothetical protein